jgi:putative glycerol-1-phosphate prenyltransferase
VYENCQAGANIIVVGNAIERDPMLIKDMAAATRESKKYQGSLILQKGYP